MIDPNNKCWCEPPPLLPTLDKMAGTITLPAFVRGGFNKQAWNLHLDAEYFRAYCPQRAADVVLPRPEVEKTLQFGRYGQGVILNLSHLDMGRIRLFLTPYHLQTLQQWVTGRVWKAEAPTALTTFAMGLFAMTALVAAIMGFFFDDSVMKSIGFFCCTLSGPFCLYAAAKTLAETRNRPAVSGRKLALTVLTVGLAQVLFLLLLAIGYFAYGVFFIIN